jgi:phosphoadenosine phosphosulfate reductase
MDNPSTPFIWAKPGIDFKKMCNQMGPPSRIHRWCCVLFKTNPFSEYLSYLVSNSKYIAYTGIRKDESINRSNYNRIMDTSKIGGQISVYPIFNWSELEEWLYIISEQIPINRDYYRGFRRVGCAICPFNSSWSEIVTRYYYPNINNQFRKILQTYAVKLGKHNLEEYITSNAWKCRAGGRGLDFSNSKLRRLLPGEDNIVNYKLTKPLYPDFISYIKPLGIIQEIMLEDKEKVFIIKKNDTNILFQISLKENTYDLQIAYSNKEVMTEYLPRLEKQLIKYQNCIFCGYCSAVCPTGAIYQYENSYSINEMKCSHCLKCVNIAHGSGCIIAKSITTSGGRVNVNS